MNGVNWRPWRFERRAKLQRPSWGTLAGALLQVPTDRGCPVGLWEARHPKAIQTRISTFLLFFSSLKLLNFHGSFSKHLESLIPSILNKLDSKNNPETRIKSTLGMQQLNQQEFNHCSLRTSMFIIQSTQNSMN